MITFCDLYHRLFIDLLYIVICISCYICFYTKSISFVSIEDTSHFLIEYWVISGKLISSILSNRTQSGNFLLLIQDVFLSSIPRMNSCVVQLQSIHAFAACMSSCIHSSRVERWPRMGYIMVNCAISGTQNYLIWGLQQVWREYTYQQRTGTLYPKSKSIIRSYLSLCIPISHVYTQSDCLPLGFQIAVNEFKLLSAVSCESLMYVYAIPVLCTALASRIPVVS